jgi:hypothetical protein
MPAWLLLLPLMMQAAPDNQPVTDISTLSWLAGCWRMETSSRLVDEQWMAPAGDGMLGMSRTVAKGRMAEHEFIQIRVQDGRLVYIAQPSSQATTTFTAVSATEREAVFENLAHDFPQRVIYRMGEGGATLQARIEGVRGGQLRGIDFPYVGVSCGPRWP